MNSGGKASAPQWDLLDLARCQTAPGRYFRKVSTSDVHRNTSIPDHEKNGVTTAIAASGTRCLGVNNFSRNSGGSVRGFAINRMIGKVSNTITREKSVVMLPTNTAKAVAVIAMTARGFRSFQWGSCSSSAIRIVPGKIAQRAIGRYRTFFDRNGAMCAKMNSRRLV